LVIQINVNLYNMHGERLKINKHQVEEVPSFVQLIYHKISLTKLIHLKKKTTILSHMHINVILLRIGTGIAHS